MSINGNISINSVIAGNVCVGCGACSFVDNSIRMVRNSHGYMGAVLDDSVDYSDLGASSVCPILNTSISDVAYGGFGWGDELSHDPRVGQYYSCYAGSVSATDSRLASSSGGLTSWLCQELIRSGLVDGIVHLVPKSGESGSSIFEFSISRTVDEVGQRRKSHYYSASMADVLKLVVESGGRYAFVGVPCYARAVRLLATRDDRFSSRFPFIIGLVCGHMKSGAFAEYLSWQEGQPFKEISAFDFRIKEEGRAAHDYSVLASYKSGDSRKVLVSDVYASNWGYALFQLNACNFCDDIFAESADVVFGDAWIRPYSKDWRGTNVVVVRSPIIANILTRAVERGVVVLDRCSVDSVCASQAGNFRHRWDGFVFRASRPSEGRWHPRPRSKVVDASISSRRKRLLLARQKLSEISHESFRKAKQSGQLEDFLRDIRPYVEVIDELGRSDVPIFRRVVRYARRLLMRGK